MIKLVVGLGNPGKEYAHTRHNAGFWWVQHLAERLNIGLRLEARYHGWVGRGATQSGDLWLQLPDTFMNASGRAVAALARFYKIQPEEVLVAHDELDFPPGTVKLKLGGGVAGHNGLTDIAESLGSKHFWRLRIGIGHPGDKALVPGYVLSAPSPDDRALIDDAIGRSLEVVPLILAGDLQGATTKLHTRPKPAKPAAPPDGASGESPP